MTLPEEVSFERVLDTIFASANWLDACTQMLSVFLESVDECREDPGATLPGMAPAVVDQVAALAGRAKSLELRFREMAEKRGPSFQTTDLGAVLWWAGMAAHKASSAAEGARHNVARHAWEDAFVEIHALLYEAISALSLLGLAEEMILRMDREGVGHERPN
jgi:hypothetical protein